MRVLLDGYNMGLRHGTGVATYGRGLSRALKLRGHDVDVVYGGRSVRAVEPLIREVSFFDAAAEPPLRGGAQRLAWWASSAGTALGCQADEVPVSGAVVWESRRPAMPAFDRLWNCTKLFRRALLLHHWSGQFARLRNPDADVAHWTYPLPVEHASAANIYTLHDLVPLRLPHTTLDDKRRYFRLCKRIAARADHIVTVSEWSRQDIIRLLGVSPDRVTNTYQTVDFPREYLVRPDDEVAREVDGTYGLDYKGYFLFFGAVEPKKNLGRLVEAYLASGVATPLVVVGAPGWGTEDELRHLESLTKLRGGGSRRVLRMDYLPQSSLVTLIRGARATIFPSLYEGFGLPVVESMLLGTAVLTSNTSCLPEIAGDAALLVDPYSTADLARSLRALDADADLRQHLESAGRRRAESFGAAAHAQRIDGVYRNLGVRTRMTAAA
ncbi:glycosyltransferase family 1 protein [Piscinibacter sakaiensis]|uniref:Glycosyltransferase n=1 Tax=Piscinibacter sakaiensis TaxID=1547922 RepID=A0A0K8P924_PISS1|nr:glycosyltransferase family 1 protein [Piscinibacter sakaiensis]GAP38670.1 glycosyltransferase [Piscinibacter sakaiensis]